MLTITKHLIGLALALPLMSGCAATPTEPAPTTTNPYTHGNVQLSLVKGQTTQSDVLEIFGAPNVATVDGEGREVWTYQKNATLVKSTTADSYGTIILAGAQKTSTRFESSSRTMTLIIKFDSNKRVVDFSSRTSSF